MLERGLTRLIKTATQRTARGEEPVRSIRVRPGHEVTVSVQDPADG